MTTTYNGSRSPVRAINTASTPSWASAAPRPRSWSEPTVQELPRRNTPAWPAVETPVLACPDCGSPIQLALIPAATDPLSAAPSTQPRSGLHAAPEPGPLPTFEDSIQRHKRDLIARALEENDGVMTRAAKALSLKYTTFVAMVHRLDVLEEEGTEAE